MNAAADAPRNGGEARLAFGEFRFDPDARLLVRGGSTLPLTPRSAALLAALLERRGMIVSREELTRAVWGDAVVEENNLHQQMAILRRILGNDPQTWIETVPRRGYRFRAADSANARWRRPFIIAALTALAVCSSWILYFASGTRADAIRIDSLAILPLKSLSPDPANAHLNLGLADALISRVGAMGAMDVRPLSAVHRYVTLDDDPIEAGRVLQVDAVLDGTVERSGERLRFRFRLHDVRTGHQLWSGSYQERMSDLFAVQDRVSDALASSLPLRIAPGATPRSRSAHDPVAVEMYLRGRYHFERATPIDYQKAIASFRRSVEIDPSFAPSWAGLGDALNFTDRVEEAKRAAHTALDLDPRLADAHATLGNAYFFHDRNPAAAERALRRAIALNPSCVNARHWYAYVLAAAGRMKEALRQIEHARRIDPLSLRVVSSVGTLLYFDGRFEEAIAAYEKAIDLNPDFPQVYVDLALAQAASGNLAAAATSIARAREKGAPPDPLLELYIKSRSGDANIRDALHAFESANPPAGTAYWIAACHTALGERDEAFVWLDRASSTHVGDLSLLPVDPKFEGLRQDPRFEQLVRRLRRAG